MKDKINIILDKILPYEIYEYGFANLKNLLSDEYKKYHYGISIFRKLDDDVINGIKLGPTIEYYNLFNAINNELNSKIEEIVSAFNKLGLSAKGINATLLDSELNEEFQKSLRYKISHKMIGTRAGLGWIGKTDLFISKRFGPRVRMASVLIEYDLGPTENPIEESLCGKCNICIEECPAKAATGKLWNIGIDRNEFYDPFKCKEKCKELTKTRINKNIVICGICISVCPRGKEN